MSEQPYHDKEEKDEKQEEKRREEEEKEEKNRGEKWRSDPLGAVTWAGILIWAGIALLIGNIGLLDRFEKLDAWGFVFIGAGLIVLLETCIRLLVPAYRRPVTGNIILAIILLAIGLGDLISWGIIWPLVLIGLGLFVLARGLGWRR